MNNMCIVEIGTKCVERKDGRYKRASFRFEFHETRSKVFFFPQLQIYLRLFPQKLSLVQ